MSNTNTVNKKVEAFKIVASMQRRKTPPTPKEVKARFIEKLGMTKAMAATYYHNINSGKWEKPAPKRNKKASS